MRRLHGRDDPVTTLDVMFFIETRNERFTRGVTAHQRAWVTQQPGTRHGLDGRCGLDPRQRRQVTAPFDEVFRTKIENHPDTSGDEGKSIR